MLFFVCLVEGRREEEKKVTSQTGGIGVIHIPVGDLVVDLCHDCLHSTWLGANVYAIISRLGEVKEDSQVWQLLIAGAMLR